METASITRKELREYLAKELPVIIEETPDIQRTVFLISRKDFADKDRTEDRFDRMFEELKKDREENNRKWEESNKKWEEHNRKWEEHNRKWEENNGKWEESNKKWEETGKRLDDLIRQSDERAARSDARFEAMLEEIRDIRSRQESSVGALGARWGIAAESSFRNALKGILERRFDVRVINVTEYDHEGFVFGLPDQVELDIIIRNGEIIICEIKSSMSRSDIYIFHRKVQFYEKQHNCKATSMIVISPMIDKYAQTVAGRLGIEVYSYSEDVRL
ncbi:MAG: hypothetical protein BWK80_42795 [Desulfobacteraceae bacterium IS3]|nr:MAG: hypothetical protein BWK80_42795 [Desulfobacteraceae bacterium IS3]